MYIIFFPNDKIVWAIKKIIELKLHYIHALKYTFNIDEKMKYIKKKIVNQIQ